MQEDLPKIANATYRLLDFFPESDPLTNKAKEKVFSMLDNWGIITSAYGWASIQKEKAVIQLLGDMEVLENYLQMAAYRGWLNHISFLILKREYGRVKNEILLLPNVIKRHLGENGKKIEIDFPRPSVQEGKEKEMETEVSSKALSRQEKILQILSSKGGAQVADIVKEIPNITKRTVRRDLDYLLKHGKIIRMGEWNQVFYKIKDSIDGTKKMS